MFSSSLNLNNQNVFSNGLLTRSKNVGYKPAAQQPQSFVTPKTDSFVSTQKTNGAGALSALNAFTATQPALSEKEVDTRNQELLAKLDEFDQNADLYDDMFTANANVGHFQNVVSSGALDKYDLRDRPPVVSNRILQ